MKLSVLCLAVALLWPVETRGSVWSLLNPELKSLDEETTILQDWLQRLPVAPAPQLVDHVGFHSGFAPSTDTVRWVQVDLGEVRSLDAVVIVPAYFGAPGEEAGPYGFPPRFRVDASNDADFTESHTLLDHTATEYRARMAPLHIEAMKVDARFVRFTATQLDHQPGNPRRAFFCLGEMLVFSGGVDVAARAPVRSARSVETLPTWSPLNLTDGVSALGLPVTPRPDPNNGWHSAIAKTPDTVQWVQVDLGESKPIQEVRLIPAHPPDFPERPGFGFPLRFKIEASDEADFSDPRLIFDYTGHDFQHPGDNPVPLPGMGVSGRYVRVTATRLWERTGDFVFALAELEVYSGGKNVAYQRPVTALANVISPLWNPKFLTDGRAGVGALLDWNQWLEGLSARQAACDRLEHVHQRQTTALQVAHDRAFVAALSAAAQLLLLFIYAVHRSHRARRSELEALRERIARDLHDEIGSHLGSITLTSELALRDARGPDREALEEIHRLSREAAGSMRGIIWLVREPGEPTFGKLMEAMKQSATTLLAQTSWEMEIEGLDLSRHAPLDFHRHVFLFFREAVHNIARHAAARHVSIGLAQNADGFKLTIADDGRGFDANAVSPGSGLANLKHRAEALRGRVELASEEGRGTCVTLRAPLS